MIIFLLLESSGLTPQNINVVYAIIIAEVKKRPVSRL